MLRLQPLAETLQDRLRLFLANPQADRGPYRFVGLVLGYGLGDLRLDRFYHKRRVNVTISSFPGP